MERRRFLRSIIIASTASVVPLTFIDKVLENGSAAEFTHGIIKTPNIAADFEIEYATKTIKYVGCDPSGGISLPDLYSFIRNEWDETIAEYPLEKRGEHEYYVKELNLMTKRYDEASVNIHGSVFS